MTRAGFATLIMRKCWRVRFYTSSWFSNPEEQYSEFSRARENFFLALHTTWADCKAAVLDMEREDDLGRNWLITEGQGRGEVLAI